MMNRNRNLVTVGAVFAMLLAASAASAQNNKPNVVLMLADNVGLGGHRRLRRR